MAERNPAQFRSTMATRESVETLEFRVQTLEQVLMVVISDIHSIVDALNSEAEPDEDGGPDDLNFGTGDIGDGVGDDPESGFRDDGIEETPAEEAARLRHEADSFVEDNEATVEERAAVQGDFNDSPSAGPDFVTRAPEDPYDII